MAKLTQCPNGHFYDMERSPQCPYCGQPDPAAPLDQDCVRPPEPIGWMVRCSNGHVYSLRKSSHCPYCEQGVPGPPDRWVKCPNGHFYDLSKSSHCPYCGGQNTADIPPADGAGAGQTVPLREEAVDKTVPLQDEAVGKTVPLQEEAMSKTQPLTDAGMGRTVSLADTGTPIRQSNWQPGLLRIALGATAFDGLLAVFLCFRFLGNTYGKTWSIRDLLGYTWTRDLLIDIICCIVTCLCCVWCLRAKGTRPGFPLSAVLAAANIGLALYGCGQWFKQILHFGLRRTMIGASLAVWTEAVTKVFCLIAVILAWAAIFLYQKKQKQNKIQ